MPDYDPNAQANLEFGYDTGPQMTYDGRFVDQEADLPLATDPSGNPSWDFQFSDLGKFLRNIGLNTTGGNALKSIGSLFTGKSDYGSLGQLAAFGGIAALLNKMMSSSDAQKPVGYQGGIPKYTINRTQTPMSVQRPEGYRPGQGGISYFTPLSYTATGSDLARPTAGQTVGGSSGGSNAGVNADTSVATPGYTGPVIIDGEVINAATGGYMPGGIASLATGGRFLRGPGDGTSDSIPARFAQSGQPARLADGEFVIDARTVSELGNGSSEAGARKLYAMMDRVHKARQKAGRGKDSRAEKYLPK